MAITIDDFSKIWASTSPLTPYEFSENNYKEGWNFIGSTPPSRQMWDFLQKNNDEKMQYLANNYLPLSGGTITGGIVLSGSTLFSSRDVDDSFNVFLGGTTDSKGSYLALYGQDNTIYAGAFRLYANANGNTGALIGKPSGELTWNGKTIERVNARGTNYIRYEGGLQVCWGYTEANQTGTTVTYPVAFIDSTYRLLLQAYGYSLSTGFTNKTSTSVKIISSTSSVMAGIEWVAIGFWK